jgi:hypothetical protein
MEEVGEPKSVATDRAQASMPGSFAPNTKIWHSERTAHPALLWGIKQQKDIKAHRMDGYGVCHWSIRLRKNRDDDDQKGRNPARRTNHRTKRSPPWVDRHCRTLHTRNHNRSTNRTVRPPQRNATHTTK